MAENEKSSSSIASEVRSGGRWVVLLRLFEKSLGAVRLIVLARLLAPDDFGLFGIALLTLSTVETLAQTGFYTALVQKKENAKEFLDTAWTVSVIRGTFLFVIIYCTAPFIAGFFHAPEAADIVRVIGFSAFLAGFVNIGVVFFEKELQFQRFAVYQAGSTFVDFSVAVICAIIFKSAWALVFGMLAGSFMTLFLSYLLHPFRPRFHFEKEKFKELFRFGRWIFGSTGLTFMINQGDDIVVGRFLGSVMLGFYQMAFKIANLATTEVAYVITKVTFPAYSKMQTEKKRIAEAYLRVVGISAFVSLPLAGGIYAIAPELVSVVLGEKWLPLVGALQILTIAGAVRSVAATTGPVFFALGKPYLDTRLQLFRFVVLFASIIPLTRMYALEGASFAVLLSLSLSGIGFAYSVVKLTGCDVKGFLLALFLPVVNTGIMIMLVLETKALIGGVSGVSGLLLLIGVGVLSIVAGAFCLDALFKGGSFSEITGELKRLYRSRIIRK